MIDGNGLGILRPFFIAETDARATYAEMHRSTKILSPIIDDDIDIKPIEAILLFGGCALGMKPYLKIRDCSAALPAIFLKVQCP